MTKFHFLLVETVCGRQRRIDGIIGPIVVGRDENWTIRLLELD